ncbi:Mu transposase C-terminal domain-containing protein [Azorhizobium sp. AG788]|uniref:Mu transposase C-terminal domain-containing protein n=1 Tax=Azorhizobium sp. AG788 TaxID=2183897 RepID=UPI0031390275
MNDQLPVPSSSDGQPARFRFAPSDLLIIEGVEYTPVSQDEHGHVLARRNDTKFLETFTHAHLDEYLKNGLIEHRPQEISYNKVRLTLKQVCLDVADLPERARRELLSRKAWCDLFLAEEGKKEVSRSDASIRAFVARHLAGTIVEQRGRGRHGSEDIKIEHPPAPTTLRRWLKIYKMYGFQPMSLCDNYMASGNDCSRFSGELTKLMDEHTRLYLDRKQPTLKSVRVKLYDAIRMRNMQLAAEGKATLPIPSRRAFETVVKRLDPFQVYAARNGVEAAMRKFSIVRNGLDVTRPLEVVQGDGNTIPLSTLMSMTEIWERLSPEAKAEIERSRLKASVVLDVATRCVLGLLLVKDVSSASSVETLRMAVSDKREMARSLNCRTPWDMMGTFETIITDNGPEYANEWFQTAVLGLHAEASFPPAGVPQMRGHIERFFRTMHTDLFGRFSGRTFENVVRKGDYDAEGNASLFIDDLWRLIVRWVVDVYHNTSHAGLGGETPRSAWLRLTKLYPPQLPPDVDRARHLFGLDIDRQIGNHGVRVLGLNYQSVELQKLRRLKRSGKVRVRIDRADIGHISVEKDVGEWLTVECIQHGFDGVSAHQWMLAAERVRRRNANLAKVSETIVFETLAEIEGIARAAEARAGIESSLLDHKGIEAFERTFTKAFDFDRGDAELPLFDDLPLAAGEVTPNDGSSPEPTETAPSVTDDHDGRHARGTSFMED